MDEQYSLNLEAAKSDTTSTSSVGPSTLQETHNLRVATAEDVEEVLKWARAFHKSSAWSDVEFDENLTRNTALGMISDPSHVILLHDYGMIGGRIEQGFFSRTYAAREMFWYAEKHGQKLLDVFEVWAFANGADIIIMARLPVDDKTDRVMDKLYRRKGYEARESFYVKRIEA